MRYVTLKQNLSYKIDMRDFFKTNSYYEGLIQNLYAGSNGCFSMFMHFFYQFTQSAIFFEEYKSCFEKLYQAELENSRILSELLIKIGGDNKFYSSSRKFLSGNNVDYIKNSSQIFSYDVEMIEVSILECKSLINKIDDNNIKQYLHRILDNKKLEMKILKEQYFSLKS